MSYRNAFRLIFVTIFGLSAFQANGAQTRDLSAERQSFSRYILANSENGGILSKLLTSQLNATEYFMTYIFGKLINADAFDFLKRAGITVTFSYHPDFLQDVRFFAQYYYGQDYYNMYFANTLNTLRFGMMVDTFNI